MVKLYKMYILFIGGNYITFVGRGSMKKYLLYMFSTLMLLIFSCIMPETAAAQQILPCKLVIDNHEYKPEVKDDIYTFLLPYEADTSNVKFIWLDALWEIKLGKTTIKSGDNINLSKGECTFNSIYDGIEMPVKIVVMKGSENLPSLYLNMSDEDCSYIHDKKGNEAAISVDITNTNDESKRIVGAPAEVKGRGNVSWTRAKKSYQIKFDEKTDVLGMGNAKRWILLPSSYDLSMVRNAVAFEMANAIGMEYTPDYRFVDLYMAGRYYGVYTLCEKPEMKKNRIDVDSVDDNIENVLGKDVRLSDVDVEFNNNDYSTAVVNGNRIDLTGGYNLEFDNYSESKYQFKTEKDCRVTISEPEMISNGKDVYENDAYRYIREFMQKAEDAVYGYDEEELQKYIDVKSFALMYIMKDFTAEGDANRNMHIWKESDITGDGLLHAGPAWDYDCSMDRDSLSIHKIDWQAVTMDSDGSGKWLGDLLRHKVYRDEIVKQYELHKDLFTTVKVDGVNTSPLREKALEIAATYAESSKMDTVRWTGTEDFCKKENFSDADREASLKVVCAFVVNRNEYFEERMDEISKMVSPVKPTPRPTRTPKPTPAPTAEPTPVPDADKTPTDGTMLQPTQTPIAGPTPAPVPDESKNIVEPTKKIKKGDKIKDKTKTAVYLVKSVKNGKIEVGLYKLLKKNKKSFKVPDTIKLPNGKKAKVTAISANAFKKCKKLKKIVIGKNVKSVGKKEFKVGKRKIVIKKR